MTPLSRILIISCSLIFHSAYAQSPMIETIQVQQSVLKMALNKGVSADDAVKSLRSKALELNLKFVGHQTISEELKLRDIKTGRLEIFQFCNPFDAHVLAKSNPIFAAYMPCRISLVEDKKGKLWLVMLNLDIVIDNKALPNSAKRTAKRINDSLIEVLTAGATGEL